MCASLTGTWRTDAGWMRIENIVDLAIRGKFARTMLTKQNIFHSNLDFAIEVNRVCGAGAVAIPTAAAGVPFLWSVDVFVIHGRHRNSR